MKIKQFWKHRQDYALSDLTDISEMAVTECWTAETTFYIQLIIEQFKVLSESNYYLSATWRSIEIIPLIDDTVEFHLEVLKRYSKKYDRMIVTKCPIKNLPLLSEYLPARRLRDKLKRINKINKQKD